MSAARLLESISAAELEVIVTQWSRDRRELVTSFEGSSMLPAIAPGQQVVVKCGVDPQVGDVAVFRFDNQVGVHRVVARSSTWLLTWGDANALPDEPISASQVLGAIQQRSARRDSMGRALMLWAFASPRASMAQLTERVRFAYRVRAAWAQGPLKFLCKAVRAALRPWLRT